MADSTVWIITSFNVTNRTCFKSMDGPLDTSPFHVVKTFLKLILGVQIFLSSKRITHDANKVTIARSLIWETNKLLFYSYVVTKFLLLSWSDFKPDFFPSASLRCGAPPYNSKSATFAWGNQNPLHFSAPMLSGFDLADKFFFCLL
ncbi:uncharacterized protein VP01_4098g1 [Puccinia sorghi]|uniref:Uncharacterized protein n=1 Tax=Puccinia sorghi TaxID=27349 RepID=A0A0L6UTA3_9BASI|nr:uncharacterized protein VP01_4098g1 [Puccinia sorghi]